MPSIAKSRLEMKVLELCDTHLGPRGFRAVDVDCHVAGKSIVRIFIERLRLQAEAELSSAEPETAVSPKRPQTSIEDCAEVSRLIGPVLDTVEFIPGPYDLEVSSPGVERRLRLVSDFER